MEPYQIEHLVDVIGSDSQTDQVYNSLVYELTDKDAYVWAPAYLDDRGTLSIYGPFKSETDLTLSKTARL